MLGLYGRGCVLAALASSVVVSTTIAAARLREPDARRISELYQGARHLALAEGRFACVGPAANSGEVQRLTAADLGRVRHGVESLWACAAVPGAAATLDSGWRDPGGWVSAAEARTTLSGLRREYLDSIHRSPCVTSAAMHERIDAIVASAFSLGDATAKTLCAIATWKQPLPLATLRDIASALEATRTLVNALPSPASKSALRSQIAALQDGVERNAGEHVYASLSALSSAIESALASSEK